MDKLKSFREVVRENKEKRKKDRKELRKAMSSYLETVEKYKSRKN